VLWIGAGDAARLRMTLLPHRLRLALAAAASLAIASSVAAAPACGLSVAPIAFGAYDPFAGPRVGAGSITVACAANGAIISLGAGRSGNVADRWMTSGAEVLRYNVYADAPRTQVFGTGMFAGSGTMTIPLYGRIPAGQAVAPGAYSDALVVTVLY
jgi:spore coat protein U-like protein